MTVVSASEEEARACCCLSCDVSSEDFNSGDVSREDSREKTTDSDDGRCETLCASVICAATAEAEGGRAKKGGDGVSDGGDSAEASVAL